jgi:hypothetical protein
LALTLGLVLSACGQSDELAGVSARVGASDLTVSQVQERSQEVLEVAESTGTPGIDSAALNRAQVGTWVREQLSALAAAEEGIVVTDGEIDRFLDDVVSSNGTTLEQLRLSIALQQDFWVPPSQLENYARSFLEQQELGRTLVPQGSPQEQNQAVIDALTQVGNEAGVEISPRYGTWDPENGLVDLPPNDLSTPAASPGAQEPELLVPDVPSQG